MGRLILHNKCILTYEDTARERFWGALSKHLITKYGNQKFASQAIVEEILLESFSFFITDFKRIVLKQDFGFYLFLFWLHEESIELSGKILKGAKLEGIEDSELARYRRILKLALEQGCDVDFQKENFPSKDEKLKIEQDVQDLLYLGTWIYGFADRIALQKMIEECHIIFFDENNFLVIDWQYHYGVVYHELFPLIHDDYVQGTFDEMAVHDLKKAIGSCFKIDYDFAVQQIFKIKEHHASGNAKMLPFQTIQPHILPSNLAAQSLISESIAKTFYDGLTINRINKLSIEDAVYKPYSMQRYFFRPILTFNIKGEDRILVGSEKYSESLTAIATNALHWNAVPKEWLTVKCLQLFVNKKGHEHDKILEDKIEGILKEKSLYYCRNIKSFKQLSGNNIRIDNPIAGEIDYIIVNKKLGLIHVADTKYNRARYEPVGYRNDYTNFVDSYEPQLQKKISWVEQNTEILQDHLRITQSFNGELDTYKVEGIFFINTPTFYMFNGNYKAITLNQIPDYMDGKYAFPIFKISKEGDRKQVTVEHPYFRKTNPV